MVPGRYTLLYVHYLPPWVYPYIHCLYRQHSMYDRYGMMRREEALGSMKEGYPGYEAHRALLLPNVLGMVYLCA